VGEKEKMKKGKSQICNTHPPSKRSQEHLAPVSVAERLHFYVVANSKDAEREREREREWGVGGGGGGEWRQTERERCSKGGRKGGNERERWPKEGEREGGREMETHNTFIDT
jgi:hypothetical protein